MKRAATETPEDPDARPELARGLVLLIEDEAAARAAKLKALARGALLSVLGTSSGECRAVALAARPQFLVLEAGEDGALATVARELLERDERIGALILGPERAERARRRYPPLAPRLHALQVPLRSDEVDAICHSASPVGPFSPAECVQAAGLGGHSLVIDCVGAGGARLGSITLEKGEVLAAHTPSASGFPAFRELVARTGTRAVLRAFAAAPPQPDLTGDWQFLLLEAFRQHDDAQRAPAADAPAAELRQLIERGVRAVVARDYEAAIRWLEAASRLDPSDGALRHRLTRLYALRSAPS